MWARSEPTNQENLGPSQLAATSVSSHKPDSQNALAVDAASVQPSLSQDISIIAEKSFHFFERIGNANQRLSDFLDFETTVSCSMVDKTFHEISLRDYSAGWRRKLTSDFNIPSNIASLCKLPHVVYKRLENLLKQSYTATVVKPYGADIDFTLFDKIRYVFCAPGYDPFSMPWLFFPFTENVHNRFQEQLTKEGGYLEESYFSLACRVGNLAFIQFMVRNYDTKIKPKHLNLCTYSGNLDLIKYCVDVHYLIPSIYNLELAVASGKKRSVVYFRSIPTLKHYNGDFFSCDHTVNSKLVPLLKPRFKGTPEYLSMIYSIACGDINLIMSISLDSLEQKDIEQALFPKTMSLKMIEYLIKKFHFNPTKRTLRNALEGGHIELTKFIIPPSQKQKISKNIHVFKFCTVSGDIEFVKEVIREYTLVPESSWLDFAVYSGNVSLVQYLIATYTSGNIGLNYSDHMHGYHNLFPDRSMILPHVPMAKFLFVGYGRALPSPRFVSIIAGNSPVTRYLITELGYDVIKEFSENCYLPIEMRLLKDRTQIHCNYLQQLSSNHLFRAFRSQDRYQFQLIQPQWDLSALGETFISAICLFLRERFQNDTFLEVGPPCSFKKQNTRTILKDLAQSIFEKSQIKKEHTAKLLIPFSIDEEDHEWHLLEILFYRLPVNIAESQNLLESVVFSAKIYTPQFYKFPNGKLSNYAVPLLDIKQHFSHFLNCIREYFGEPTALDFQECITSEIPDASLYLVIMALLHNLRLINPEKIYKNELTPHQISYELQINDPRFTNFISSPGLLHWKREVLGFLFVNLNRIPSLIEKSFHKTDSIINLTSHLNAAFFEDDKTTPKLITYHKLQRNTKNHCEKNDYFSIKATFLETYEFDGFDSATGEFIPAFPGDTKEKYIFPIQALAFSTALAIFFGLPNRPEKACVDEGAIWTWRQYIRNFFGGWNPIEYNPDTEEYNIEGKILLNLILLITPVKITLALLKLAMIPFKTTINIVKFFTEFLPTLLLKNIAIDTEGMINNHGEVMDDRFMRVIAYNILLSPLIIFRLALKTITSPEKSLRTMLALINYTPLGPRGFRIFIALMLSLMSIISTIIFWSIISTFVWQFAAPVIAAHFPTSLVLFSSFTQIPVISKTIALIKGPITSLCTFIPEINIPIAASLLIVTSYISDVLSNAWARWIPAKSFIKLEFPFLNTNRIPSHQTSPLDKNKQCEPSDVAITLTTAYETAGVTAIMSEGHTAQQATKTTSPTPAPSHFSKGRRSSTMKPKAAHLDYNSIVGP